MKTKILSLLGTVLLVTANLSAQSFDDALRFGSSDRGVGSRALGMGNAYTGVADDFSATYWNPAGLAQMRRIEVSGGITNFNFKNSATFLGATTDEKQSSTKLDNLGFAFPFPTVQGSFVLSFGYNRTGDYTTGTSYDGFNPSSSIIPSLFDNDTLYDVPYMLYLEDAKGNARVTKNVNQSGMVKESGGLGHWAFAGAMDVAKDLSFGVTLNILSGSYKYQRNYLEADTRNFYNITTNAPTDPAYFDFNKFYLDDYVTSDITGVNFMFGMMYRADRYRVGITIKTPTSVKISESYSTAGEAIFDNGDRYSYTTPETKNDYGVMTPWTFGAGVSVEPIYGLLLSGDADYTDWTQIEWIDNTVLENDPYVGTTAMEKAMRAVLNLRLGAEYEIPGTDVRVRGGYMHTPSQYENDPSSYDRNTYTGGAGILLQNNVLLDLGLAFGSVKTYHSNYTDSALKFASRTDESIKTTRVNFTISYRF
jgi:long-subunit fatty acid transport protein